MILEMLADKKITAEEAAELLRALGADASDAAPGAVGERHGARSREGHGGPEPIHERWGPRPAFDAGGRSILEDFLSKLDIDWGNLGFAFGGDTYRFEEEARGEFAAGAPVSLELVARNGRVEVYGWEGPGWRVIMRKRVRAADEAKAKQRAAEIARFEAGPSRLFFEEQATGWGSSGVSVEIHLPRQLTYDVRARSSNGRVVVEGLLCQDLVGRTANGKVSIREVRTRSAELSTANGGLTFEGTAAQLECHTANGQINLCPVPLEDMRCRLHTSNGSIRVRAPEAADTGYRVEAHTGHGGLEVALAGFEVSFEEKQFGRRRLRGQSSGYEGKRVKVDLTARTSNGSIRIGQGPPLSTPRRGEQCEAGEDDRG
jgi:hypothetical protein